jgi:hypothetical protein
MPVGAGGAAGAPRRRFSLAFFGVRSWPARAGIIVAGMAALAAIS